MKIAEVIDRHDVQAEFTNTGIVLIARRKLDCGLIKQVRNKAHWMKIFSSFLAPEVIVEATIIKMMAELEKPADKAEAERRLQPYQLQNVCDPVRS
jgi:hypothetical protein